MEQIEWATKESKARARDLVFRLAKIVYEKRFIIGYLIGALLIITTIYLDWKSLSEYQDHNWIKSLKHLVF